MFVDWVREEVEKGTAGGRGSRSLGRTPRRPRDYPMGDSRDYLRDPRDYPRERSYRRNAYPERRGGRFVY